MLRTLTIFAAAALIAIAVGAVSAQDAVEVVDSTARGGVKAVIDRVDAEEAARAAADVTLQNNIDAEALARAAADASLQSNLDAEAAARATADAALDGRVTALEAVGGGGTGLLRTIVVSPVGPTEVENGLELFTALENTDLMVPPPSAQDPVLIKVEPGVYNTSIFMRPFVDVEGSGPGLTVIKGTVGDFTAPEPLWIVFMASNSELRELSVQFESSAVSAGGTVDTGGIVTGDDQNVSIRNVRIKGPSGPVRTHEGVKGSTGALVRVRDVDIDNVLIAIRQAGVGTIDFEGVRTDDVVVAETGTLIGRRSIVGQIDTGVFVTGDPVGSLTLATTQVLGSNTSEPGTSTCVFSYDASFVPLGPAC